MPSKATGGVAHGHPAAAHRINGAAADHLDRIPDCLLLVILNKLADVRSLGRCAAVSRRFDALVHSVHDVHLRIDRVVIVVNGADYEEYDDPPPFMSRPSDPSARIPPLSLLISNFFKLVLSTLLEPFQGRRRRRLRGGGGAISKSYHSPALVLKRFAHVRNLTVELPAGDVATEEGVLLKWRAEFGSTLQTCVVIAGTVMNQRAASIEDDSAESIPESLYADGELKLRVVWTMGSLIAACTRHHLLRPIIEDHPTLESVVLTDADGQGTLSMGAENLRDFREKPAPPASAPSSNRTQVPATNMTLRYATRLDLPGGLTLQGVTMVAIKPCNLDGSSKETDDAFVSRALDHFDEPFRAAADALMKRQSYNLEMNGF